MTNAIFDLHKTDSPPLNRSPNNLSQVIRRPILLNTKLVQISPRWLLCKCIKYNLPTGQTTGWIFTRHILARAYVKRHGLMQECAFWGFFDITAHLACHIHQDPYFWAWIGVFSFKPNVPNIQTFILSKLLHQSQLNFSH